MIAFIYNIYIYVLKLCSIFSSLFSIKIRHFSCQSTFDEIITENGTYLCCRQLCMLQLHKNTHTKKNFSSYDLDFESIYNIKSTAKHEALAVVNATQNET